MLFMSVPGCLFPMLNYLIFGNVFILFCLLYVFKKREKSVEKKFFDINGP